MPLHFKGETMSTSNANAIDLSALRTTILTNLATALTSATARLATAAAGHPTFTSDVDLKATLALLKTLPQILPLLPEPDEDDDTEDDEPEATDDPQLDTY